MTLPLCVVIILAEQKDLILEYNRYPDIVRQVSIIQYPTFHKIYDLRPYFANLYGSLSERVTMQPFTRD